jgi:hypothetical protein
MQLPPLSKSEDKGNDVLLRAAKILPFPAHERLLSALGAEKMLRYYLKLLHRYCMCVKKGAKVLQFRNMSASYVADDFLIKVASAITSLLLHHNADCSLPKNRIRANPCVCLFVQPYEQKRSKERS